MQESTPISDFQLLKISKNDFLIYGPASVEIIDNENDLIDMEAFKKALPELLKRRTLSLDHKDIVVGEILDEYSLEGKIYKTGVENDKFMVLARVFDDIEIAKNVREGIIKGEFKSYSISGQALKQHEVCEQGVCHNHISDINLSAVTICSRGMNPGAKFEVIVKHIKKEDNFQSNFPMEQFVMGLKVETEHSETVGGDPVKIGRIVLDHLAEDLNYYTKLQQVEKPKMELNLKPITGGIANIKKELGLAEWEQRYKLFKEDFDRYLQSCPDCAGIFKELTANNLSKDEAILVMDCRISKKILDLKKMEPEKPKEDVAKTEPIKEIPKEEKKPEDEKKPDKEEEEKKKSEVFTNEQIQFMKAMLKDSLDSFFKQKAEEETKAKAKVEEEIKKAVEEKTKGLTKTEVPGRPEVSGQAEPKKVTDADRYSIGKMRRNELEKIAGNQKK